MGIITANSDYNKLFGDQLKVSAYNQLESDFDWSKVVKVELENIDYDYILGGNVEFGQYGEAPLERLYITNYRVGEVEIRGNFNPNNHYSGLIKSLQGWDLPIINEYLNSFVLKKIAATGELSLQFDENADASVLCKNFKIYYLE